MKLPSDDCHWTWTGVNCSPGNGLVPSGTKLLPEPMLTKVYVTYLKQMYSTNASSSVGGQVQRSSLVNVGRIDCRSIKMCSQCAAQCNGIFGWLLKWTVNQSEKIEWCLCSSQVGRISNYNHSFMWDVINHPCSKSTVKFWHGWSITSHSLYTVKPLI